MSNMNEEQKTLTYTALGIFKGPTGQYFLAKMRYNPETKETGEFEIASEGDMKIVIEERFKIASIKEGII